MDLAPHLIVADLHGELLRGIALAMDTHYSGLAQAARHLRSQHIINNRLATKLAKVDFAYNFTRHVTVPAANAFVIDVLHKVQQGVREPCSSSSTRSSSPCGSLARVECPVPAAAASPALSAAGSSPRGGDATAYYIGTPTPSIASLAIIDDASTSSSLAACQTELQLNNSVIVDEPTALLQAAVLNTCSRIALALQPRMIELDELYDSAMQPPRLPVPDAVACPAVTDFDIDSHTITLQHIASYTFKNVLLLRYACMIADSWASCGSHDVDVDDVSCGFGASCIIEPPTTLDCVFMSAHAAEHIIFLDQLLMFMDEGARLSHGMGRAAILDLAYSLRLPVAPVAAWYDSAFDDAEPASALSILDRFCAHDLG